MLDLSIVRGPLLPAQNEEILSEVNRLTNSHIALKEFCRWMQESPDGPAFHALLQSDRRIVGHFSLMLLRACLAGKSVPVARTEYFFVHEQFRAEKVRGFEDSFLSPAMILLDSLYSHCREIGWGPFLASAAEAIHPFHELAGCQPVDFPLHECLLALRPWQAASQTPNVRSAQRVGLLGIGLVQSALWTTRRTTLPVNQSIAPHALAQVPLSNGLQKSIELFRDRDSFNWRYPTNDYVCLSDGADPASYVIAKKGSDSRYLRVCQWHLQSMNLVPHFVRALAQQSAVENSLGLRWSVFENGEQSGDLLRALRKCGFLCAPRVRKLLIHSEDPVFLDPKTWKLNDSLFCFDL